jgi:hypothetical protein
VEEDDPAVEEDKPVVEDEPAAVEDEPTVEEEEQEAPIISAGGTGGFGVVPTGPSVTPTPPPSTDSPAPTPTPPPSTASSGVTPAPASTTISPTSSIQLRPTSSSSYALGSDNTVVIDSTLNEDSKVEDSKPIDWAMIGIIAGSVIVVLIAAFVCI